VTGNLASAFLVMYMMRRLVVPAVVSFLFAACTGSPSVVPRYEAQHLRVPQDALWPPTLSPGYRYRYFLESSGPWPAGSGRDLYSAASTIPFAGRPFVYPDGTALHLPPDGFVIYAALAFPGRNPPPANPNFPPSQLPLRLAKFQVRHQWEGQVAPNVPEYLDWTLVAGQFLDVRMWFGTQHPSRKTLRRAQRELGTLQVPPLPKGTCPNRPADGLLFTRSEGPPGSTFKIAGAQLPGRNESGHIAGPGTLTLWWNLDASKYWTAVGPSPVPLSSGPVMPLGRQGRSSPCGYEIRLRVPNVSPGSYRITPVEATAESATSLLPLSFRVTSRTD
jgi:hypothetical protein